LSRHRENVAATCTLLRELLETESEYRYRWHRMTDRGGRTLCQAAVARVVEAYLVERGDLRKTRGTSTRRFKDRVYRAMRGEVLSRETLDWLMLAFDMKEHHRRRLLEKYVSGGSSRGVSDTLRSPRPLMHPQLHRTVTVFERYTIDHTGALRKRHTMQTIRAINDGVSIYVFNHEPEAAAVTVIHGGRLGEHLEYGGGLVSKEIRFDRPLSRAETTSLEYETTFRPGHARLTEVRRTAFARCENVDMCVEFTGPPPAAAWWCAWDDQIEGLPVFERPVQVQNGFIRKYLPFIENTVVGFRWLWR
jgi:hypothetical protein